MNSNAIIFDLDGTILDSMPAWESIDVDFLAMNGIEAPPGLNDIMKKLSFHQSAQYFIDEFKLPFTHDEVITQIKALVDRRYRYEIGLKPFVLEYLEQQLNKKIKMCIATATHLELAELALVRLGILKYFEFVITCQDVNAGKEEPQIYLKSAEMLGVPVEKITVFEDALHCIKTAKAVGFSVVGIYDMSSSLEVEMIKKCCDRYIESYEELLDGR